MCSERESVDVYMRDWLENTKVVLKKAVSATKFKIRSCNRRGRLFVPGSVEQAVSITLVNV